MKRDSVESRIRTLQSRLDASTSDIGDWKIIRIYEARLRGEADPYDFAELDKARQGVRNEIRRLQAELEEAD